MAFQQDTSGQGLFPRPFLARPEGSGVQTICYTAGGSGGLELVLPQAFIGETRTKEIDVLWENKTLTVLKLSQPQAYLYCLLCTDTAAVYRNEKAIGNALKELSPKHGLNPEDIFITSKLGMESPWSLATYGSLYMASFWSPPISQLSCQLPPLSSNVTSFLVILNLIS